MFGNQAIRKLSNKVKPITESTTHGSEDQEHSRMGCCRHCMKATSSEQHERVSLMPQAEVMRFGYKRNLTYLMSQLIVNEGRVHLELCLSDISKRPLDIRVQHDRLLVDVDDYRQYCTSCKCAMSVRAPDPLGYFKLPPYIEPNTILLSFVAEKDTLVIEGCVKDAIV